MAWLFALGYLTVEGIHSYSDKVKVILEKSFAIMPIR